MYPIFTYTCPLYETYTLGILTSPYNLHETYELVILPNPCPLHVTCVLVIIIYPYIWIIRRIRLQWILDIEILEHQ